MKLVVDSVNTMQTFAAEMALSLPPGSILALFGELGSGKTTFSQGLARGLGVEEEVTSPTFKLVSEYRGKQGWFYHIDCYRLNSPEEFLNIDGEKYLSSQDGISVIEWADRIEVLLPMNTVRIRFARLPGKPNCRELQIAGWAA